MPAIWTRAGIGDAVRLANCDRLRALALFDIIAFHTPMRSGYGFFAVGLPLFLLLSVSLGVRRRQPEPLGDYAARRARRLLVPWLFWSGVYAVYLGYRAWRTETPAAELFQWPMLIGGTYYHLWFLPLMFAAGMAAQWANQVTRKIRPWRAAIGAGVAGVVLVCVVTIVPGDWGWPYHLWWFSLPALALGFAFGRLLAAHVPMWGRHLYRRAAILMIPITLATLYFIPYTPIARYDLALMALIAAVGWPGKGDWFTARLQPCILGIYLVHPIVLEGMYSLGFPTGSVIIYAAVAMAISGVIVLAFRWTPLRVFV